MLNKSDLKKWNEDYRTIRFDEYVEVLKSEKGKTPIEVLNPTGDAPPCPACGHYNAMLHAAYYDGITSLFCRDCGHLVVNAKEVHTP